MYVQTHIISLFTLITDLFSFDNSDIAVVLGSNTLNKGGDVYQSERIISHPKYSSALIRNDIGLIKVDKDIVFGDKVKPVALPSENFSKIDYPAVLSGWGTTSVSISLLQTITLMLFFLYQYCCVHLFFPCTRMIIDAVSIICKQSKYPGQTPNKLYHIQLSVIDQKQCLNASFRVTNDNICTLNKRGEGACHVSAFTSS